MPFGHFSGPNPGGRGPRKLAKSAKKQDGVVMLFGPCRESFLGYFPEIKARSGGEEMAFWARSPNKSVGLLGGKRLSATFSGPNPGSSEPGEKGRKAPKRRIARPWLLGHERRLFWATFTNGPKKR